MGGDFHVSKYAKLIRLQTHPQVHLWVEPKNQAAAHDLRRKRVADNTLEECVVPLLACDVMT